MSELIKGEGDCVVTALHKIFPRSRGRESGSADDASIMLADLDEIWWAEKQQGCVIIPVHKGRPWGMTCHLRCSTRYIPRAENLLEEQ